MLSFADSPGAIFNRLGSLGGVIKQLRSYQLAQLVNMTDTTFGVTAQFVTESDIQALMGSSYLGILSGTGGSVGGVMQSIAQAALNRTIFRDNPQLNQDLTSQNTLASLLELIRQMKVQGATVLAMPVTATPITVTTPGPHFTGIGNGIIVVSVRRPLDGLVLENSFSENILFTCVDDSYIGGATAGNEGISITGTGSQNDVFAFNWPLGSNCQASLNAVDGNVDNGSGNILTNSGFTNWTSNVPDNWTLVTGTAGTNIAQESSIIYDGSGSSLRLIGDGSTLTTIKQAFDSSTGTGGTLDPLTQYSFNVFCRRDGTAAAAGVLTVDLVDSNNTVLLDANGSACTFNIDLTALTTVFTGYSAVFRTPLIMPSSFFIRKRLSTALTNTRSVYFDKGSLSEMIQLYTGGPFANVHSGGTPFVFGDYGSLAVSNTRGTAGTLSTFQVLCYQLFSAIGQNELLLPSSSVPTLSDANLII